MSESVPVVEVALEGEALVQAIKAQVEYYFSRENLAKDRYLVESMDSNQSVELSLIMNFKKMKSLTEDEAKVKQALEGSTVVSVVGDRIQMKIVKRGGTIILREVPDDVEEAEVRAVFDFAGCKPVSSVKKDIGNTWFIMMESDEDAKDTIVNLTLQGRRLRDAPVKARLKQESSRPVVPFNPNAAFASQRPFFGPAGAEGFEKRGAVGAPKGMAADGAGAAATATAAATNTAPGTKADPARDRKMAVKAQSGANSGNNNASAAAARGKSSAKKEEAVLKFDVDPASFPALSEMPTPGYKTSFIKYSFDDIINIVKNIGVDNASIPEELRASDHPLAMTATPNLDLLQRQRTFSIDETREQLQQGVPVQRLAISETQGTEGTNSSARSTEAKISSGSWAKLVSAAGETSPVNKTAPANAPEAKKKVVVAPAAAADKKAAPAKAPAAAKADAENSDADKKAKGAKGEGKKPKVCYLFSSLSSS